MIRTQISFDPDLYAEAKRVAKRRGVSLAELCRLGLRNVLGREVSEAPWMKYVGMFTSEDDRTSEAIDEVVYGRERP
ncbi:MAG: CopG family transcriptional regulator [Myxococcaceae bacterium]